jgi:hypothetical protein
MAQHRMAGAQRLTQIRNHWQLDSEWQERRARGVLEGFSVAESRATVQMVASDNPASR